MSQTLIPLLIVGVIVATAGGQTTWSVDDDNCPGPGSGTQGDPFRTIQDGIDAAQDGDTVLVADGVYTGPDNKNLDFGGKLITVRSENGPDSCIIDCEGEGRGFYFQNSETPASIADGFTITNGYVDGDLGFSGGGISVEGASPTLVNLRIIRNRAWSTGGGVYIDYMSEPTLLNCLIAENWAKYGGGGIYSADAGSPTILDCVIKRNPTDRGGGGVRCSANLTITRCVISDNSAAREGGGIMYYGEAQPTISNCVIKDNRAGESGGGVSFRGGYPTIRNCLINSNFANEDGGGIGCRDSAPTILHCAITGNMAGGLGGGLYTDLELGGSNVANCIVWNNTAPEGAQIAATSSLTVSYSDVQGGLPSAYGSPQWGDGNLDVDPAFAFTDDQHLMPESP